MAPNVFTDSLSEEEHIYTDKPSRPVAQSEGASGFEDAFGSEEVSSSEEFFRSEEASTPATTSQSALWDEANSADSTPATQTGVPTPVVDQPNWWFVEGQYQLYTNDKLPNDKRVMTQTLTLERQVLTGSLPTLPAIHEIFTRHRPEWTN